MKSDSNIITKLYSVEQLSEFLNVSDKTIHRLKDTRKIPFYKIKGCIRFAEHDVLKFLDDSRVESDC